MNRREALKILGTTGIAAAGALTLQNLRFASGINQDKTKFTPIGLTPMHGVDPQKISFRTKAPESQTPGGMDQMKYLTNFDYGKVSKLPDGRIQREYTINAIPQEIEIANNVKFPAWTFNGTVPGPTLRANEGDLIKINFGNGDSHSHTLHFHGIHPANMDGVFEVVPPGGNFVYEFAAKPFGIFPYHCHVLPLTKHIEKGLYGTLIIDPKKPRKPAKEMIMVMNGFDIDFDGENEFYTVNGIANYYVEYPIKFKVGELIRIYLSNMTEHDLINSFHLHANMFNYYPNGTTFTPSEFTDTIMQCQGQRGIIEFTYDEPGQYLFHAHQSEFAELGWLGVFEVSN